MQRSYYTQAIVINIKQTGENNSSVTLLTPEKGIIYATLYGGPKSKLKSLVALWHSGKIWLYENPEKKTDEDKRHGSFKLSSVVWRKSF